MRPYQFVTHCSVLWQLAVKLYILSILYFRACTHEECINVFTLEDSRIFTDIFDSLKKLPQKVAEVFPFDSKSYEGGVLPSDKNQDEQSRQKAFKDQAYIDWSRDGATKYHIGDIPLFALNGGNSFESKDAMEAFIKKYLLIGLDKRYQEQYLVKAYEHLQQGGLLHKQGFALAKYYNYQALMNSKPYVMQFRHHCYLYPIHNGIGIVEESSLTNIQVQRNGVFDDGGVNFEQSPLFVRQYKTVTFDTNLEQVKASILNMDIEMDEEAYKLGLNEFNRQVPRERKIQEPLANILEFDMKQLITLGVISPPDELLSSINSVTSLLQKTVKNTVSRTKGFFRKAHAKDVVTINKQQISDIEYFQRGLDDSIGQLQYATKPIDFTSVNQQGQQLYSLIKRFVTLKININTAERSFTDALDKEVGILDDIQHEVSNFKEKLASRTETIDIRLSNIRDHIREIETSIQDISDSYASIFQSCQKHYEQTYIASIDKLNRLKADLLKEQIGYQQQLADLEVKRVLVDEEVNALEGCKRNQQQQVHYIKQLQLLTPEAFNFPFNLSAVQSVSHLVHWSEQVRKKDLVHHAKSLTVRSSALASRITDASEESLESMQSEISLHKHELNKCQGDIKTLIKNESLRKQSVSSQGVDYDAQLQPISLALTATAHNLDEHNDKCSAIDEQFSLIHQDLRQHLELQPFEPFAPFTGDMKRKASAPFYDALRDDNRHLIAYQKLALKRAKEGKIYQSLIKKEQSKDNNVLAIIKNYYQPRMGWLGLILHPNRHHKKRAEQLFKELTSLSLEEKKERLKREIILCGLDDNINHQGSYYKRLVCMKRLLDSEASADSYISLLAQ